MRKFHQALLMICGMMWVLTPLDAQTFTMSKKCREQIATANRMNAEKQYDSALAVFNANQKGCNSKDGKEAVWVGKARSFNGLKKHTEAIAEAEQALKIRRI